MQNFWATARNGEIAKTDEAVKYDAIYTGAGGDITVIHAHDTTDTPVVYAATVPGTFLPVQVKRIVGAAPAGAVGVVMSIGGRI